MAGRTTPGGAMGPPVPRSAFGRAFRPARRLYLICLQNMSLQPTPRAASAPCRPTAASSASSIYAGGYSADGSSGLKALAVRPDGREPAAAELALRRQQDLQRKIREAARGENVTIIDPRGALCRYWDVIMAVLLAFTAVVTPFEVGILDSDPDPSTPLFWVNRAVDALFVADVVFNFRLAFYDVDSKLWVYNPTRIARQYAARHAPLDCVSALPYDLLALAAPGGSHGRMQSTVRALRVLRLIKALRLVRRGAESLCIQDSKLEMRSAIPRPRAPPVPHNQVRASRLVRRLEDGWGLTSGAVQLAKFFGGTLLLCHWMGCLLVLTRHEESISAFGGFVGANPVHVCSWESAYLNSQVGILDPCAPPPPPSLLTTYLAAVYWAAMTISTVGCGERHRGDRANVSRCCEPAAGVLVRGRQNQPRAPPSRAAGTGTSFLTPTRSESTSSSACSSAPPSSPTSWAPFAACWPRWGRARRRRRRCWTT